MCTVGRKPEGRRIKKRELRYSKFIAGDESTVRYRKKWGRSRNDRMVRCGGNGGVMCSSRIECIKGVTGGDLLFSIVE